MTDTVPAQQENLNEETEEFFAESMYDHSHDKVQDDATGRKCRWEEDGMTVIRTNARTAPGCHDNCGLLVYVKDGKIDHIEGDPENPYNQGRLCLRCLAAKEVVYHPDRILHPMKRAKEDRGKNTWERISWDEAYDIIYNEMMKVVDTYGAKSIIVTQGTGRDINGYNPLMGYYFGTPNSGMGFLSGEACYAPRMASTSMKAGGFFVCDYSQFFPDRFNDPRWQPPGYILIWGNNPVVANSDGTLGYWIVECMKRGSKIICVDPKLTWMAGKAEYWFQIRPGTDLALMLAMCNAIVEAEAYDKDFCEHWTYGFEEFCEHVRQYTPEWAAEVCGIDADKIREAALAVAEAPSACLQWGVAIDHCSTGFVGGMACFDLMALTGNFEKPGSMVSAEPAFGCATTWMPGDELFEGIEPPSFAAAPTERMDDKYPVLQVGSMKSSDMWLEAMETGEPYPIKAAWLQTNNTIANMGAESDRLMRALQNLDFVVTVDLFMTPTALATSDVFLPACTCFERIGVTGHQPYQLGAIQQCIEPLGESKSDMQIIYELGRYFAGEKGSPWNNPEEFNDYVLRHTPFTYEELKERTWAYPEFEYAKNESGKLRPNGEPGFNATFGRYNFYCVPMANLGFDPFPVYEEPHDSPIATPDLAAKYPLVLTTGARRWGLFHSEHRQVPSMRQIHEEPFCMIHPETAAEYGIKDGDMVRIENDFGSCVQKAEVSVRMRKGVVAADHGWWFPERGADDGTFFGVMEANINKLLPMRPGPTGLGNEYKSQLCRISKAN